MTAPAIDPDAPPTLATVVAALRTTDPRFPWVHPTPEDDDVAAVLEFVEAEHRRTADEPGPDGAWGWCTGCDERWPCRRWVDAEYLGIQWLGRAADRVYAHAQAVMDRAPGGAA